MSRKGRKRSELEERYARVPEEVKFWVERVYAPVIVVRRDMKPMVGLLLGAKFDLKELEVGIEDVEYDHRDQKYYMRRKHVVIPSASIFDVEFVLEEKRVKR